MWWCYGRRAVRSAVASVDLECMHERQVRRRRGWKRYVARKVQRLLTTYFAAPEGLAEPQPWSPPSEADEPFEEEDTRSVRTSLSVDAHQNLTVEVDVPAHGETPLTRYFSWSRRS